MSHPLILALVAIVVWWASTGVILLAIRRADLIGGGAHARAVLAGVPIAALGVAGVVTGSQGGSVGAVVAGFLGALAVWGWVEMAFLAGIITGPERKACPPGVATSERFWRAWQALAHHEMLLLFGLLLLVVLTAEAGDRTALDTYLVLYIARISAKLNLFFGVPRINMEFLPARLAHLAGFFRQGPATAFFALSVTLLTFATACFVERLIAVDTPEAVARFALLSALAGLATLEHWLMVLPLPDAKLWRWMLPASGPTRNDPLDGKPSP